MQNNAKLLPKFKLLRGHTAIPEILTL